MLPVTDTDRAQSYGARRVDAAALHPDDDDALGPGAITDLLGNQPALDNVSTCMCNWAGVITVTNPGQTTTMIP